MSTSKTPPANPLTEISCLGLTEARKRREFIPRATNQNGGTRTGNANGWEPREVPAR